MHDKLQYARQVTVCNTEYSMQVFMQNHQKWRTTVCKADYSMKGGLQYAIPPTVCKTDYSMQGGLQYAIPPTVCKTDYSMQDIPPYARQTVCKYARWTTVCKVSYSMQTCASSKIPQPSKSQSQHSKSKPYSNRQVKTLKGEFTYLDEFTDP